MRLVCVDAGSLVGARRKACTVKQSGLLTLCALNNIKIAQGRVDISIVTSLRSTKKRAERESTSVGSAHTAGLAMCRCLYINRVAMSLIEPSGAPGGSQCPQRAVDGERKKSYGLFAHFKNSD